MRRFINASKFSNISTIQTGEFSHFWLLFEKVGWFQNSKISDIV